jgi:hypothetical protein
MASSEVRSRAVGDSEVSSPCPVGGNRNGGAGLASREPRAESGLAGVAGEFAVNSPHVRASLRASCGASPRRGRRRGPVGRAESPR